MKKTKHSRRYEISFPGNDTPDLPSQIDNPAGTTPSDESEYLLKFQRKWLGYSLGFDWIQNYK